jgi:ferredoxin
MTAATLTDLLEVITTWETGMPVRPMEDVLRMRPPAGRQVAAALDRWDDDEDRDLLWLIVLLGELRDPAAVPPLRRQLRGNDLTLLPLAAAEALAKIGPAAIPALEEAARSDRSQERLYALAALGWIPDDRAYGALIEALERDRDLAHVAATALVDQGRPEAIPSLYRALRTCPPWQHVEIEEAIRALHRRLVTPPLLRRDWRLRYRRIPSLGTFDPGWAGVAALCNTVPESLADRKAVPVRPLEQILEDQPPREEAERCERCEAPIEHPTGLPVCPEDALFIAAKQCELLAAARHDGFHDLFDYLDDLEAWGWDRQAERPKRGAKRARWEREGEEIQIYQRTCEWLIERGAEDVDTALALLRAESVELAQRYGDPDGLLETLPDLNAPHEPWAAWAPAPPVPALAAVAAAPPRVGRNEPCPCGSGKKYKKCCGRAAGPPPMPEAEAREPLLHELARFAGRSAFATELRRAFVQYWGEEFADLTLEEARVRIEDEPGEAPFWDWLFHDFRLADGRGFADHVLADRGAVLDVTLRALLERQRRSVVSLYRVDGVRPGEGLTLRDLLRRETVRVRERAASAVLVRWDLIAARVVEVDGRFVIESLFPFPAAEKDGLMRGLAREYRSYLRAHPEASREAFLKERGYWFHHYALALARRPPPQLVTAEGDPLLLCRARYRVRDVSATVAALRRAPGLYVRTEEPVCLEWLEEEDLAEEPPPDLFAAEPREARPPASQRPPFPARAPSPGAPDAGVRHLAWDSAWLDKAGGERRRALGRVEVVDDHLTLECMSRRRLERGRALLERHAGAWLAHREDTVQDAAAAIDAERFGDEPPVRPVPPNVAARLRRSLLDDHYRRWPDMPMPALDGRTPREAAATPGGRARVRDMIRTIENLEEHARLAGEAAYDASWLWQELGLEPDA